jgi:hypothetical protein
MTAPFRSTKLSIVGPVEYYGGDHVNRSCFFWTVLVGTGLYTAAVYSWPYLGAARNTASIPDQKSMYTEYSFGGIESIHLLIATLYVMRLRAFLQTFWDLKQRYQYQVDLTSAL